MSNKIALNFVAILLAGIFFVINDAIINFLSPLNIKFYHFVFYGTPAFIVVPIYLIIKGQLKLKMQSTNYFIPIIKCHLNYKLCSYIKHISDTLFLAYKS